jgi:hypothetical protein
MLWGLVGPKGERRNGDGKEQNVRTGRREDRKREEGGGSGFKEWS